MSEMKTGQKLAVMMNTIGMNFQTILRSDDSRLMPPIEAFEHYEEFDLMGKLSLAKMSSDMANDCAKLALLTAFIEDPNSEVFGIVASLFDQAANLILDDLGIPA